MTIRLARGTKVLIGARVIGAVLMLGAAIFQWRVLDRDRATADVYQKAWDQAVRHKAETDAKFGTDLLQLDLDDDNGTPTGDAWESRAYRSHWAAKLWKHSQQARYYVTTLAGLRRRAHLREDPNIERLNKSLVGIARRLWESAGNQAGPEQLLQKFLGSYSDSIFQTPRIPVDPQVLPLTSAIALQREFERYYTEAMNLTAQFDADFLQSRQFWRMVYQGVFIVGTLLIISVEAIREVRRERQALNDRGRKK